MKLQLSFTREFVTIAALAGFIFGALYSVAHAEAELPDFSAATFSNPTTIDHPFFSLPVGKVMEFEGDTEDGFETIRIEIPGDTKDVLGVTTLVYRDMVYVDDELVENTFDYLAQDDEGNVWYFGEDVDNYEDGELTDHDGSWLAGVDGAEPGYWMPGLGKLVKGYAYREEWYQGEAEDEAEIVSLSAHVAIGMGNYTNCLETKNTTALEPDVIEYKYYCRAVAGLVLEEKPGDGERVERIAVADGEDGVEDEAKGNSGGMGAVQSNVRSLQAKLIGLLQQIIALMQELKAKVQGGVDDLEDIIDDSDDEEMDDNEDDGMDDMEEEDEGEDNVTKVETTAETQGQNDTTGVFTITFRLSAFENDFYITDNATTSSSKVDGGVQFTLDGPGGFSAVSSGVLSSTADEESNGVFRLSEGESEEFTLTVSVNTDTSGLYRVGLNTIYITSNPDGITGAFSQPASPASDYRTEYININAN